MQVRISGLQYELWRSVIGPTSFQHACFATLLECIRISNLATFLVAVLTVLPFSASISWHTADYVLVHYVLLATAGTKSMYLPLGPMGLLVVMRLGGLGPPVPFAASWVAFSLISCTKAVRLRIEATGDASSPLKGQPLEIMGVSFFICEALLVATGDLTVTIYAAAAAGVFTVFIMLPSHAPASCSWILSAAPPERVCPNTWFMMTKMLLELHDAAALGKLAGLWSLAQVHNVCMGMEDSLFGPQLTDLTKNVDYVIGHPRSGTTALHQALIMHPKLEYSTFYDLWCPTLVSKVLLTPLKPMFAWVLRKYDTPNHRVALEEPFEEDINCIMRGKHVAIFALFPAHFRHPECPKLAQEVLNFDENDVRYMLRFIARCRLYQNLFGGVSDSRNGWIKHRYLARVLGMTKNVDILRNMSPGCRFVVCERDQVSVLCSNVQVLALNFRQSILNEHFRAFMNVHYQLFSKQTFRTIAQLCSEAEGRAQNDLSEIPAWRQGASHVDVLPVHFEQWKGEPVGVVRGVLTRLLGDEVTEEEAAQYTAGADMVKHENDPECRNVVKMD